MSSGAQLQFSRYLRNLVALGTYLNISDNNTAVLKASDFYQDPSAETGNEDMNAKVHELLENMVKLNKLVINMNGVQPPVEPMYSACKN